MKNISELPQPRILEGELSRITGKPTFSDLLATDTKVVFNGIARAWKFFSDSKVQKFLQEQNIKPDEKIEVSCRGDRKWLIEKIEKKEPIFVR